jgi:hypothetical protein
MSTSIDTLAQQAVNDFRAELSEELLYAIGEQRFQRLELLVARAVAAGLHETAERLEALSQSLRAQGVGDWNGMEL